MTLNRLSLSDFRNHADLLIEPGPGFVVLTGDNGAGKTNILEAISLLSPGRGLRGAPVAEMARALGCYPRQVPEPILAEFNMSMLRTATTTDHGFSSMAIGARWNMRYRNWTWRRAPWRTR